MKEESLLRQTLLTVGVLVGAATVWVGLLSIVLVTLTQHAFARAESTDAPHAASAEGIAAPGARARAASDPAGTPAPPTAPLARNPRPKPNG